MSFLGRRGRTWAANLDMYKKVPIDLLEGSKEGKTVSWIALAIIVILMLRETQQFMTPTLRTELKLDSRQARQRRHYYMNHDDNHKDDDNDDDDFDWQQDKVQVNFNITLMDLKCQYATINVVSVLGSEQNITKDIHRYHIDADGVQRQLARVQNPNQHDLLSNTTNDINDTASLSSPLIQHYFDQSVTESIETLHEDGIDAVELDPETLDYALDEYEFVFVNYHADWCSHCQDLAPTWERFAEVMHDVAETSNKNNLTSATEDLHVVVEGKEMPNVNATAEDFEATAKLKAPVLIAKFDCVKYKYFCDDYGIGGYPTLQLYVNGDEELGGAYSGDRTILSFVSALIELEERVFSTKEGNASLQEHALAAVEKHLHMTPEHEEWLDAMERVGHHPQLWDTEDHPGCNLVGTLHMNRSPGRFFIESQGKYAGHDIVPRMANLSHVINHLSFESTAKRDTGWGVAVPKHFRQLTQPFNGNVYATHDEHQAYHHYIKLVSTNSHYYQVQQNSQLMFYSRDQIPEAKFILDISPIAVHYHKEYRLTWYDYLTNVLAIVGGTLTVIGMLDSVYYHVVTWLAKRQYKQHVHDQLQKQQAPLNQRESQTLSYNGQSTTPHRFKRPPPLSPTTKSGPSR